MNISRLPDRGEGEEKRCSMKTPSSSGSGYWKGKGGRCARHARFEIDGIPFCGMHSGEICLKEMIGVSHA